MRLFYLFAHLRLLSSDSFFWLVFLALPLLWSSLIFSSLLWLFPPLLFHLSILSEVWLLNFLRRRTISNPKKFWWWGSLMNWLICKTAKYIVANKENPLLAVVYVAQREGLFIWRSLPHRETMTWIFWVPGFRPSVQTSWCCECILLTAFIRTVLRLFWTCSLYNRILSKFLDGWGLSKNGIPKKKLVRQHFWYIFAMQWQFLRASLRGTCACNTHISWQKPGFFLQMCCLQALPRCWRPVKTGDIVYPPCQQGAGNRQLVGIWVVTSDSWVWPKHHLNYFETKKYMLCFVERLV